MKLDIIYKDNKILVFNTRRNDHQPEDSYGGINICHYVGDSPEHVAWSRQQLCSELGIKADALIVPRQTHSINVKVIDHLPVEDLENIDAVVTRLQSVAIGVSTADCVPVLLADEKAGVIAASHAGWRGAVGGIVQHTVATMTDLGASPADMKAWLGPCICQSCFEVGEEVANQFPEEFIDRSGAKPHVDLPAYVISTLTQCGLQRTNITPPQGCTRCNPDTYFSARRLGIASGRIFSALIHV
ncbi:MAG: peptidoglycan editing factor PgeF [Bacteroidales bacterium]|nr:peptidoglycan editing factor PgeF [Bacteroidales bacterium]